MISAGGNNSHFTQRMLIGTTRPISLDRLQPDLTGLAFAEGPDDRNELDIAKPKH